MAMVTMAATMFHRGHSDVGEIETAYHTLLPLMGVVAAGAGVRRACSRVAAAARDRARRVAQRPRTAAVR